KQHLPQTTDRPTQSFLARRRHVGGHGEVVVNRGGSRFVANAFGVEADGLGWSRREEGGQGGLRENPYLPATRQVPRQRTAGGRLGPQSFRRVVRRGRPRARSDLRDRSGSSLRSRGLGTSPIWW